MSTEGWLAYLDGVETSYPEDIALFPYVDEEPDTAPTRERMLQARFRWLKDWLQQFSRDDLYTFWQNHDMLIDARRSDRQIDLHDFYNQSWELGLHLLRAEVENLTYYKQLRDALKLRVRRGTPILVFGPTSGAEIETIGSAGGAPKLAVYDPQAPWVGQLFERMFHDNQEYEIYTYDEFACNKPETHFVVLSNFIPDIPTALNLASKHVGSHGFVLFSARNKAMVRTAEKLGLIRMDEHRDAVAVYLKHRAFTEQE